MRVTKESTLAVVGGLVIRFGDRDADSFCFRDDRGIRSYPVESGSVDVYIRYFVRPLKQLH